MIKVLKFGGASIKNSERIANVFSIINNFKNQKIIIVFSAIANVTNLLEDLVDLYFNNSQQLKSKLLEIRNVHAQITKELFEKDHQVFIEIEKIFSELDLIFLRFGSFTVKSKPVIIIPGRETIIKVICHGARLPIKGIYITSRPDVRSKTYAPKIIAKPAPKYGPIR